MGGYITSTSNSMLFLSSGYSTLSFNSLNIGVDAWIGQSYMACTAKARVAMRSAIPSYLELQGVISRTKEYDSDGYSTTRARLWPHPPSFSCGSTTVLL